MAKNNNPSSFKSKTEPAQEKRPSQKIYYKFGAKKTKSVVSQSNGKEENKASVLNQQKLNVSRTGKAVKRPQNNPQRKPAALQQRKTIPLKIYALGGLNEIGKNIYAYECANDIFIIDCGMAFPDDEMLGIDSVIPDFTYLEANRNKLRGIVLTHGHEDHIGSLPYLLKKINVPVYGTRLTLGLVEGKLKEHGILSSCKLITVKPGNTVKLGCMAAEFIRVNHSIPDACAIAVHTPAGVVVHTGDFKIDYTPIEGGIIDLTRLGELGNRGVLALLSESTNAERPGYSMSERTVGNSFKNIFNQADGRRIIVATFSSNIHRIQQIIDNAVIQKRKVAISGRSMLNVIQKAIELNYIKIPSGILIDIEEVKNYPPEKIVIVTTGSQGEPLSALTRMANNEHKQVVINPNDLIIISANPIPGNEKLVGNVVNDLMRLGADVVYEKMYEVHVSGHACQEELKMMISLTKPKFFVPIHGEYKHLKKHALLAEKMGIPKENIFIADIGQVLETNSVSMKISGSVPAGKVLVDGLSVGDVGAVVLRERKRLAEDGLIAVAAALDKSGGVIVSGPDIFSRGFVYVKDSETLMRGAEKAAKKVLDAYCASHDIRQWAALKSAVRDAVSEYIYQKTKRSPMILPIIMEV